MTASPGTISTVGSDAILPALSWRGRLLGLGAAAGLAWTITFAVSALAGVAA